MKQKKEMILVFKTSARKMYTVVSTTANISADTHRISAFAREILKWENPEIELFQ
jgi:hypothetical protein